MNAHMTAPLPAWMAFAGDEFDPAAVRAALVEAAETLEKRAQCRRTFADADAGRRQVPHQVFTAACRNRRRGIGPC